MVDQNPLTDAHTLRFENPNSFSLPVIDGSNPFQFNFIIWAEANGGSTWYVDNLILTTRCPSILEFYPVAYQTTFDSYKGAPLADSLYTFPPTYVTLPKCNGVIDYSFNLVSYTDLSNLPLATS